MQFHVSVAVVILLALSACSAEPAADKQPAAKSVQNASAVAPASMAASSPSLAKLPDACQTLLNNLEKCVVKYEKMNASDAQSYRLEFEQLKAQIVQGVDEQGLEQACVESNKQAQSIPATQC